MHPSAPTALPARHATAVAQHPEARHPGNASTSSARAPPATVNAPADTVVPSARRQSTYGSQGTPHTGVSDCRRADSTCTGPLMVVASCERAGSGRLRQAAAAPAAVRSGRQVLAREAAHLAPRAWRAPRLHRGSARSRPGARGRPRRPVTCFLDQRSRWSAPRALAAGPAPSTDLAQSVAAGLAGCKSVLSAPAGRARCWPSLGHAAS